MKKINELAKNVIEKHPIFVFLLFIAHIVEIIKLIVEIIKSTFEIKVMETTNTALDLVKDFNWIDFFTQFIIVLALYLVLKAYFKLKNDVRVMVTEINNGFKIVTDNTNDLGRILNNKIHYLSFYMENKNLDDDSYIKKLNDEGFSKEDLEEIKIDETFLKQNGNKLLPRTVINKKK